MVDEGIRSEFIAIVNYGIIGLIQLELGYAESADITNEEAMALYDKYAKTSLDLMLAKNHDYDEAWRSRRVSSSVIRSVETQSRWAQSSRAACPVAGSISKPNRAANR